MLAIACGSKRNSISFLTGQSRSADVISQISVRLVRAQRVWLCRVAAALALLALWAGDPAAAAGSYGNCYWDGTPPICAGSCKPGFVVRARKSCLSGYRVQCCEPMGSRAGDSTDPRKRSKRHKECADLCARCEGKPKGMVCAGVPYNRCITMCLR